MNIIEADDQYELIQLKADVKEQGYRYIAIGLTLRYWK